MQSSLAKCQLINPMSEDELNAKKREAWQKHDILVVLPEQRQKLKNKHIEAIVEIGHILYGDH